MKGSKDVKEMRKWMAVNEGNEKITEGNKGRMEKEMRER